jgi:hypothetical protein
MIRPRRWLATIVMIAAYTPLTLLVTSLLAQEVAVNVPAPAANPSATTSLIENLLAAAPELAAFVIALYFFLRHLDAKDKSAATEWQAERASRESMATKGFGTLDQIVNRSAELHQRLHGESVHALTQNEKALEKVSEQLRANTEALNQLRQLILDGVRK